MLQLTAVSLAVVFTLIACGNEKPAEAPKTEAKITKALFVKMKAKQDAMSEQEAIDFVMTMMKKEMERCKISK